MRSTGEVMGVGENFGEAFAKAQLSAGTPLPDKGRVFLSVNDRDKPVAVALAKRFTELGFEVTATRGTAAAIRAAGIPVKTVFKVNEGRPNAVDLLKAGSLNLIIYTATSGAHAFTRRKGDPPQRGDLSHPVHHHHERRARGGGSDRFAPARSHPRVELAGNPFEGRRAAQGGGAASVAPGDGETSRRTLSCTQRGPASTRARRSSFPPSRRPNMR